MARTLTILGATGSIGASTLAILREHPERFSLHALTASENVEKLVALAREFRPRVAAIGHEAHYAALKAGLEGSGVEARAGIEALCDVAVNAELVVAAIVGAAGLKPTFAAVQSGRTVALANKEALVSAGSLLTALAGRSGATLLPVDSEHNALFQIFAAEHPEWIENITLTASGGPFREWSTERMRGVTPKQAVAHPNWSMGAKISVDSATMMNKGLELIEAYHLFPVEASQIGILVHPQSIVHGLVHYRDGSVLAQMGSPDMRTPIAHALGWPERIHVSVPRLNLAESGKLEFFSPDRERFPALHLARSALTSGQSFCCVLNAANEVAVAAFLEEKIGFLDIAKCVERTLESIDTPPCATLEDVLALDAAARVAAHIALEKAAA